MTAMNKADLAVLQAEREAVRQEYTRHIKAAAQCRHEATRLDAALKRAQEKQDAPTPRP